MPHVELDFSSSGWLSVALIKSYDLFLHNCNNFTQDFATFLVGAGLPDRITSLPQTVLNTPFGQLLKRQLETSIQGITQAPHANALPNRYIPLKASATSSLLPNDNSTSVDSRRVGVVHNVTKLQELENLLTKAKSSCAVIFFTSATCPPCKIVYPAYDELATEFSGKATLIKIDISHAYEIASKYQVKVTPTFMTFLKGETENVWSGANESQLRTNVLMLIQMASHFSHPHTGLGLSTMQRSHDKPIMYTTVPPLEKLIGKLGPLGTNPSILELRAFVHQRQISGAAEARLPNLAAVSVFLGGSVQRLESVSLFPVIDLFRLALVDPRVSGYFAQEPSHSAIVSCLGHVVSLQDKCPYPLRLVTLYLSCNLFSSPLFPPQLLGDSTLSGLLLLQTTFSLLDTSHAPAVGAAITLAYNIAAFIHMQRLDGRDDILPESAQVELMAGLLEVIRRKPGSKDELRGLLLSVGLLGYLAPQDGELVNLYGALDAKEVITGVKGMFDEIDDLVLEVEAVIG